MLPEPLHPAVVHFPLVLALLLPAAALVAVLVLRRRPGAGRGPWLAVTALAAALALSAWVAVETGGQEEERVESVVGDRPLESHEERAEQFLAGSVLVLVLTAAGLVKGGIGRAGRIVAVAGALALVPMAIRVGSSGGDLVYVHGAANAYQPNRTAGLAPADPGERRGARGRVSATDDDEH